MKNILIFILIISFFSCGEQSKEDNTNDDTLSGINIPDSVVIEKEDANQSVSHKLLLSITEDNPRLKDSLQTYFTLLSEEIEKEKQIVEIFALRKDLIPKLDKIIVKYLDSNQEDYNEDLENELHAVGLQGLYTEGMYYGLDIFPVLEKEIESVASEEFKLKIAFKNAVASSSGGEYPYDNMSDDMEVVRIGEEIISKYPNSKTAELIKEDFINAVSCFTDFHVVVYSGSDDSGYIVGCGTETNMYPGGSNKENFLNFINTLPGSKYSKVIKSILDNPSVISSDKNSLIHLVVIDIENDYEKIGQRIFNYIDNGIDIPHKIVVRRGNEADQAIVYRFFSDKGKAVKAFNYIKQTHEDAKIITIDQSGQIQ